MIPNSGISSTSGGSESPSPFPDRGSGTPGLDRRDSVSIAPGSYGANFASPHGLSRRRNSEAGPASGGSGRNGLTAGRVGATDMWSQDREAAETVAVRESDLSTGQIMDNAQHNNNSNSNNSQSSSSSSSSQTMDLARQYHAKSNSN